MNKTLRSQTAKLFIAAFMLLATLLPTRASAITTEQLLILTQRSQQLCAAGGDYASFCVVSNQAKAYANAVVKLPADERAAYIRQNIGTSLDAQYLKAVDSYNKAVDAGEITTSSDTGSSADADGNCPEGSVEVSVAVNGNETCVGSEDVNPIYAYLRGIIIFLGGAIGLAVVITIIVAGIQYSSSAGNPANITKAKERLINAVIGLVLYLFLAAILRYLVPQIFTS